MEQLSKQVAAQTAPEATGVRRGAPRTRLAAVLGWAVGLALAFGGGQLLRSPVFPKLTVRAVPDVPFTFVISRSPNGEDPHTYRGSTPVELTEDDYLLDVFPTGSEFSPQRLQLHAVNGQVMDVPVLLLASPNRPPDETVAPPVASNQTPEVKAAPPAEAEDAPVVDADPVDFTEADRLMLAVHEKLAIQLEDMQRVSIGDSNVVDGVTGEDGALILTGVGKGTTTLIVKTYDGKRLAWEIEVTATPKLPRTLTLRVDDVVIRSDTVHERVLVKDPTIADVDLRDGKLVLRGHRAGKTTLIAVPEKGKPETVEVIVESPKER